MATITTEHDKITLSTTIDPSCPNVYDVVMYVDTLGNIASGWFIRKNGKPIPRCEMLWDDRFCLHSVLKREFANSFNNPKSNFKTHLDVLLLE